MVRGGARYSTRAARPGLRVDRRHGGAHRGCGSHSFRTRGREPIAAAASSGAPRHAGVRLARVSPSAPRTSREGFPSSNRNRSGRSCRDQQTAEQVQRKARFLVRAVGWYDVRTFQALTEPAEGIPPGWPPTCRTCAAFPSCRVTLQPGSPPRCWPRRCQRAAPRSWRPKAPPRGVVRSGSHGGDRLSRRPRGH